MVVVPEGRRLLVWATPPRGHVFYGIWWHNSDTAEWQLGSSTHWHAHELGKGQYDDYGRGEVAALHVGSARQACIEQCKRAVAE